MLRQGAGRAARAAERKVPRLMHDGLPLGNPNIDIRIVDGKVMGPGDPEPDAVALGVSTGRDSRDFAVGDRVLAWWWSLWWFATVAYVSTERNYVNLRWEWNHAVVKYYRPHLVRHV